MRYNLNDPKHKESAAVNSRKAASRRGMPVRPDIAEALNIKIEKEAKLATDIMAEGKCIGRLVEIEGKLKLFCPPACPRHTISTANLDRTKEREYTKSSAGKTATYASLH